MLLFDFLKSLLLSAINMLNGASPWLIFSFIIAGVLHNILSPQRFHKALGNTKISSLVKITISGMLLPICSCGTIPLGLSLYYSGAYLGPVLAFITATPIINPMAVILSYGLLGKEITIVYLIVGFTLPIFIGIVANKFGGDELYMPGVEEQILGSINLDEDLTLIDKIKSGLGWALSDLALVVSKYVIFGMLLGGFIITAFPDSFIQKYLGNPSVLSLGNVAVLATVMYVCAVGHIPFIAALIASGAAPGVAITFLMAGAATNVPELMSIYKVIGKRSMIMYAALVSSTSLLVGFITNKILMPNFTPAINFNDIDKSIEGVNKLMMIAPEPVKYICSFIIFIFFIRSILPNIKQRIQSLRFKEV